MVQQDSRHPGDQSTHHHSCEMNPNPNGGFGVGWCSSGWDIVAFFSFFLMVLSGGV